jgi:Phosphotransferase enzyme family
VQSQVKVQETAGLDSRRIAAFVAREHHVPASTVSLDMRPLRGGLESAAVARVSARWTQPTGRASSMTFVAKRLEGDAQREAELYRVHLQTEAELAPRLIGVEKVGPTTTYLYLEYVRQSRAWPWREMAPTTGVLARLAALHTNTSEAVQAIGAAWDYEFTLADQAALTLAAFERAIRTPELSHLRKYGPSLRRVVGSVPELRRELLDLQPFGRALLHGDVHSRNVVLRAKGGAEQAVFIDWGRARIGSPLEDVSSWLESLGCWEHEVRRRHDTLLRGYLVARGLPSTLERSLRDAYWLASVSNTLSGALHYHLLAAMDQTGRTQRERQTSVAAARAHLRVIRRADSLWRA